MTNPAAERLRRANRSCIDYAALCESDARVVRDSLALAEAYLSEHLPDDGEAIDEAWLAVTGWEKGGLCMWLGEYLTWSSRRGVFVGMYPQSHIRTRGQLRLLLRALGVEGEGK